jgi:hypothetical protein
MKKTFLFFILILFITIAFLLLGQIAKPIVIRTPRPITRQPLAFDPLLSEPLYDFIAHAEKDALWMGLDENSVGDTGEGVKFGPSFVGTKGIVHYTDLVGSDGNTYPRALFTKPVMVKKLGAIVGRYGMMVPDEAGKFIALVGLRQDAVHSDGVVFHFGYLQPDSRKPVDLVAKVVKPADGIQRIEARLDQFKHTAQVFYLKVDVYDDGNNDFAFWATAGIYNAKACRVGADLAIVDHQVEWRPSIFTYYDSWLSISLPVKVKNDSDVKFSNYILSRSLYYDCQGKKVAEGGSEYSKGFAPGEIVILDLGIDGYQYRSIVASKVVIDINVAYGDRSEPNLWERDFDNNHLEIDLRECTPADALPDLHTAITGFEMNLPSLYILTTASAPAWPVPIPVNSIDSELWGEDGGGNRRLIRSYQYKKPAAPFYWNDATGWGVSFQLNESEVKGVKKFIYIMDPQNRIPERREDNNQGEWVLDKPI